MGDIWEEGCFEGGKGHVILETIIVGGGIFGRGVIWRTNINLLPNDNLTEHHCQDGT